MSIGRGPGPGGIRHLTLLLAVAVVAAPVRPAPAQDARTIRPGERVEREIAPGAVHAYALEVEADRFVVAAVEQRGADVSVRIVDPAGSPVDTFDARRGEHGAEPAVFTTSAGGGYRVEVRREEDGEDEDAGGAYTLRIPRVEPVAPTPAGRVEQLLAAWDRPDEPGAAVAVVRGGEVVAGRGLGRAAMEHPGLPITLETVFDIGSVSKELTDFAVVLLALDGRVSLDDDIRTHLPEVPDFGDTIRIRHLVHHTSGLREIYATKALSGWQSGDGIAQEDALRLVTGLDELNFEPGTEYLYSNTGYMLLADLVSRVTGTPFPEWMEENVFGPLGMDRTTIMARRGQVVPGAAHSYGRDGEGGWIHVFDNSGIQGAGGVYTTVGDLARWIGNFAEPRVGGPAAIRRMQERGVLEDGDTLDYAFGLRIDEHRGLRRIGHGGSSAGYRASLAFYPEAGVGVVVLSNHADRDGSIVRRVAEAYLADVMEPRERVAAGDDEEEEEEGPGWTPSPGDLEAYAGRYLSPELEAVYTISVEGGTLTARHRRHGDFELEAGEEEDAFRTRYPLSEVRFVRDEGGRITGFRVSNGRVRDLLFRRLESGDG